MFKSSLLSDANDQSQIREVIYEIIKSFETILSAWSAVIFIKGISVIQKFSYKKAILNFLLPKLVLALIAGMIGGLYYVFH